MRNKQQILNLPLRLMLMKCENIGVIIALRVFYNIPTSFQRTECQSEINFFFSSLRKSITSIQVYNFPVKMQRNEIFW